MGKALIKSILVGSKTLVVDIIRDTDLLTQEVAQFTSLVNLLTGKLSTATNRFTDSVSAKNAAKTELDNAIFNEQDSDIIRLLQVNYNFLIAKTINLKVDEVAARQQLFNAQKQLDQLIDELARVTNIVNVTIPMADSGLNFFVGQEIGIVEITRQSQIGADFIALPSDRIGFDPTYSGGRDGIIIPVLSEKPRGWFYNSMVISATQIFLPRYWVATLMNKNDVANTGSIAYFRSGDFRNFPFNAAFDLDVPFDYETTDSLSFFAGDKVLVEFNGESPTIIGFGSTERFETQPVAFYKNICSSTGFRYRLDLDTLVSMSGQGIDEIFPVWTCTNNGADRSSGVLNTQGRAHFAAFAEPRLKSFTATLDSFSQTLLNLIILDARVLDSSILNMDDFSFYNIKDNGAFIGLGFVNAEIEYTGFTDSQDPPPHFGFYGAQVNSLLLLPFHSTGSLIGRQVTLTGNYEIGGSLEDYDTGTVDLANPEPLPEEDPKDPNFYTKLASLSVGLYLPSDYLFDNSFYVEPLRENQFLVIASYKSYIDGDVMASGQDLFQVRPALAYGLPPDYSSISPVPNNGVQNLIFWSENLPQGIGALQGNLLLTELVSPSNDAAGEVWMLVSFGGGSLPIYDGLHEDLDTNTQYTFSCRVRRNSYCFVTLQFRGAVNSAIVEFDLIQGVADVGGGTAPDAVGIVEENEEWFRIFLTFTTNSTVVLRERVFRLTAIGLSTDHNGFNGMVITQMQVTEGNAFETYVKTTGTAIP